MWRSSWSRPVCILTLLLWLLAVPGYSEPIPSQGDDLPVLEVRNTTTVSTSTNSSEPFLLRIMPLGASITSGYQSTDRNGYRKWIRQQLRWKGWEVDMVGSIRNGTMKNNQNEGHFHYRIDEVANVVLGSLPMQPNLILINVGTNDALENYHVDSAGDRMDALLTLLYDSIPGTTILLSTLLPNGREAKVCERVSQQYRNLAVRRRAQGDRLVLAEMSYFIQLDQLVDRTHPDDAGYKEMASVWWAAIEQAQKENFLQAPNSNSDVGIMTLAHVESLDDSTSDPELPAYSAPAQPTEEVPDAAAAVKDGFAPAVMAALCVCAFFYVGNPW